MNGGNPVSTTPPEDDAPDLADLSLDDYAALLSEVDDIAQDATEQTGH